MLYLSRLLDGEVIDQQTKEECHQEEAHFEKDCWSRQADIPTIKNSITGTLRGHRIKCISSNKLSTQRREKSR